MGRLDDREVVGIGLPSLRGGLSIVLRMGLGNYTQSSEKRRLSGVIEQRGAQTGIPTLGMFLFGVPFTGIGAFVTLIGLKNSRR